MKSTFTVRNTIYKNIEKKTRAPIKTSCYYYENYFFLFNFRDTLIHIIKVIYFSFYKIMHFFFDYLHRQWVSGQCPSLQLSWHHFCIPEILSCGAKATQSSTTTPSSSSSMTFSVVTSSIFSVVCSVGTCPSVDGSIGCSSSFPSLWNLKLWNWFCYFLLIWKLPRDSDIWTSPEIFLRSTTSATFTIFTDSPTIPRDVSPLQNALLTSQSIGQL